MNATPANVNLRCIKGRYYAAIRLGSRRFTHALGTTNLVDAKARLRPIEDALYRIGIGSLEVPDDVALREFLVAGGKAPSRACSSDVTLEEAARLYAANRRLEPSTRAKINAHARHLNRLVGGKKALSSIGLVEAQKYVDARSAEFHEGRPIRPATVKIEVDTLRRITSWAVAHGRSTGPKPWKQSSLDVAKDPGREPFRTVDQIRRKIEGEKIAPEAQADLWETAWLRPHEVTALLDHVREKADRPWIYPMFCFVALTGCRRSEMARSRREDWDLESRRVRIREKKKNKGVEFTTREVDLHPRLFEAMTAWFAAHPGGREAIVNEEGKPIRVNRATRAFRRVMEGHETFSNLPGFHCLRHSVASILASKGIDQRIIDRMLGHTTSAMSERYRHLAPEATKRAIDSLI